MLDQRIAFIGSGAMAEAMISGLLRGNLSKPQSLHASDTRQERVEELQKKYAIQPFTDNSKAVAQTDVVILSVKPQRLTEVLAGLKGSIPAKALVLSIVGGAPIGKIGSGLGHKAVVRSMPNTPAQINGTELRYWTTETLGRSIDAVERP